MMGLLATDAFDKQIDIDRKCSNVIQSSMNSLVLQNLIAAYDLTDFADSLVLDERSGTCFAYDPRDINKRRLQTLSEESCQRMTCFDCAYTAGTCAWHPNKNQCVSPVFDGTDI